MFGPYEISHNGRTWHGNVALKEHHIVERNGDTCLFRVQDMAAVQISKELTEALARMLPAPGKLIPDELMRALRACGLVAEGETETPAPAAKAPGKPPACPVVNMALFLTQTCNMRCVYCFGKGGEYGERGVMSRETAITAVDWLMANSLDAKMVHIGFFGGEPLLNFSLLRQVVAYAKEQARVYDKVVKFNMTTNGSLLTNKIIAYLKQEQVDTLVSFDGPPEVQDKQRPFKNGRGSYNRIYANVQRLRKVFPKLMARATVWGDGEPFAIRRGMEQAGFCYCHLSPASPVILKGPEQKGEETTRKEAAERMLAYRRDEAARLFMAISQRNLDVTEPPQELVRLSGLVDGNKRHAGCGIGRGLHAVAVNGEVYPCHRFVGLEQVRLGHIRDYHVNGLNDYHRAVVENLPVCRACWARYFCGGGCFYHNMAHTGDMHRPDPLFCHETQTVCDDLIHGWCVLSEEDKAYARVQIEKLDPELRY